MKTKPIKKNDIIKGQIYSAMEAVAINNVINTYALENVVIGDIKPKESIPFDKYVKDLRLEKYNAYLHRRFIEGLFIDDKERIVDIEKDRLLFEFYLTKIHSVFNKVMKQKYDDEMLPCNVSLRKYFFTAFSIFKEVANTNVVFQFGDDIPEIGNAVERKKTLAKITKFLVAIKLNKFRAGKSVTKYLKDVKFIPFVVNNIIKKTRRGGYALKKDADSVEYKIAMLSTFTFLNERNRLIFSLKLQSWYKANRENFINT